MKYNYENQQKALEYLMDNTPHDIDKFKKLYNVDVEGNSRATIKLHDILFSDVWSTDEKVELIKLYEYNKEKKGEPRVWLYKTYEREIGYTVGIEGLPLVDECIKEGNYTGVEALLKLGNHISVATIQRIITYIDDPSERYKFCKLIVDHYKDQESIKAYVGTGNVCYLREIPSLCDRYPEYSDSWLQRFWRTVSSMEDICKTNDLELVKLFLPTVKDIKPLFMFAVLTGNIEMVKLFIEAGADVNYQDLEYEEDNGGTLFKTPIKIAIDNNDLEMVKFLHENGADLNFVDKSEKMQEYIDGLGITSDEKETHEYLVSGDMRKYVVWAKTPLEYAINSGKSSIFNMDLYLNSIENDSIEKQLKDRMNIVEYLYQNGATFGNGEINYTDLICFAMKSDDLDKTKFYFDEAKKNNVKLDFSKIITFIHEPGVYEFGYYSSTRYKLMNENAGYWFNMCENYLKEMDKENYNKIIKSMIKILFEKFNYSKYKDIILDLSKKIQKEDLKDIPAIFASEFKDLEELVNIGFDINHVNEDGDNILMSRLKHRNLTLSELEKLVKLGVNINYKNPKNGENALSYAISKLPEYSTSDISDNYDDNLKKFKKPFEMFEQNNKKLIYKIIELCDTNIITSDIVKKIVCTNIRPGYSQLIYWDILTELSKKGLKVSNIYFKDLLQYLNYLYYREYIKDIEYLEKLYSTFDNIIPSCDFSFPISHVCKRKMGYDDYNSNRYFEIIYEHLKRCYATSNEQVVDPNKTLKQVYDKATFTYKPQTNLEFAQSELLNEISTYIKYLDYRYIIKLIDSLPIIDIDAINKSNLLPQALELKKIELCQELIKKGATIVRYDEDNHDVTDKVFTRGQINLFASLNGDYNPYKECEDLLKEIGVKNKVKTRKK